MDLHVCQPLKGLVDDVTDVYFIEWFLTILHQVVDVPLHKLEYEMQLVVLLDDFVESNYVGMMELKE